MPSRASLLTALLMALLVTDAAAKPRAFWQPADLGLAGGEWNLHLDERTDGRTLRMPRERARIAALSAADRQRALRQLGDHEKNYAEVMGVARHFAARVAMLRPRMRPEYERNLSEVLLAANRAEHGARASLDQHLPILRALPPYTRVVVSAPAADVASVARQLGRLGLAERSRVIADHGTKSGDNTTPWVRDMVLVVDGGKQAILATPLRFEPRDQVAASDLAHLDALADARREVLRTPLFYRSGNLLLARRQGRNLLFVGDAELFLNAAGYVRSHLPRPPSASVIAAFQDLTGADRVIVMPNTGSFFHIDQYLVPLADDLVALLAPIDADRLRPDERRVLDQAYRTLQAEGFRVVAIPTVADRVHAYQSPVNIVPFRDLRDGRQRALVPLFPDRKLLRKGQPYSLNRAIREAYAAAGTQPIEVEDRFSHLLGNTHCVALALR